ncbi:C-C chemokine receptor type 10 [Gastrophryne carolinensis]
MAHTIASSSSLKELYTAVSHSAPLKLRLVSDSSTFTVDDYVSSNDHIPEICESSSIAQFARIFQTLVQIFVFVIGTSGNMLVLLTYRFSRKVKSMTDIFLINLAVADLLLLITLPFWTTSAIKGWIFGTSVCKVVHGVYSINFFSGFMFLTCISVDRYIEIVLAVKAHNMRQRSICYSYTISPVVWLASSLLSLPELIYSESKEVEGSHICVMIFPENVTSTVKSMSNFFQIFLGFIVPFFVMLVCYSYIIKTLHSCRNFEKDKALKVIISLVAVFVIFQFPYTMVTFLETTDILGSKQMSCEERNQKDIAIIITSNMAFTRCCLNPILYAFVGVRFRKDILLLLKNCGCISRARYMKYWGSSKSVGSPSAMDTSSFTL